MIPKSIHYCWFGDKPLPENVEKCISSWKIKCPDYEIFQWDESNYDVNKIPYMSEAYSKEKFAFVSDYARIDIVYNYGGIYLDTDVEVIRPFDDLLQNSCFFGCEMPGVIATGLGFGAEKNHILLKKILKEYENEHFVINGKINSTTCVEYTMKVFSKNEIKKENCIQKYSDAIIFPPEYFCPLNMFTNKITITENTYSIHHYDATWYSDNSIEKYIKKKILPFKILIKKILNSLFGDGTYEKIKKRMK